MTTGSRSAISLQVFLQGRLVGVLTNRGTPGAKAAGKGSPLSVPSQGWLQFSYDPQWLASAVATPLSLHLPLQDKPFDHWASQAFFSGLLPSGALREALAAQSGMAPDDDLALLEALGSDCPGAVSLKLVQAGRKRWSLDPGASAPAARPVPQMQLFDEAAGEQAPDAGQALLHACGELMLGRKAGMRSSWPASAAVVPIWQQETDVASSHILWMAPPHQDAALLQRAFSLELLRRLGISVHPAQLSRSDSITTLLQLRPDRELDEGGQAICLQGETLGQALGLAPGATTSRQAPGWASCFALLRAHVQPSVLPVLQLLDMVTGFVLIGDAHASAHRLRLQQQPAGGWHMAPLWDACSTLAPAHAEIAPARMALSIGNHRATTPPPASAWNTFAQQCGLSPNQVRKRARTLAQRMRDTLPVLLKDAEWNQLPAVQELGLHLRARAEQMARAD